MKAKYMRAKLLKEESVFKPKTKAEVKLELNKIKDQIENTSIRDEAVQLVANYTNDEFNNVLLSIAYYISENEFNEALMYTIQSYLEMQGIITDES